MRIEVLGCSGGMGGAAHLTTCLRVDDDILIDCGTGAGRLSLDELVRIDHVFLTHAHLDHIASLPMLIDTVGDLRAGAVTLHAEAETLAMLREHIFNWRIWPDFTGIPGPYGAKLRMEVIQPGDALRFGDRVIRPVPALHAVPAVGYVLGAPAGSLGFSGDTTLCDAQIDAFNAVPDLRYLVVETAFPESQRELALASRHLCPSMLDEMLGRLHGTPEVFVTHLKPGHEEAIVRELQASRARLKPRVLDVTRNAVFEL